MLCRNDAERARLLDMSRRLRRAERDVTAVIALVLAAAVPSMGPWVVPPVAAGIGAFWLGTLRLRRMRRPERALAACWLLAQLGVAGAVLLARGPRLYLLPLFIVPTWIASIVWPRRAATGAVGVAAVLMVATAFAGGASAVVQAPWWLLFPLATMLAGAIPAAAVRDLDEQSRQTAIVDALSGTLNRLALEPRVAELAHQTSLTREPVAVVVGDVDCFKAINDGHGHPTGDAVLQAVARRLVRAMGGAHPVYRLGGEEFLVLLPGADVTAATEVAERLRAAVSQRPARGLPVTMSLGVSASEPGEPFDYGRVFAAADAALYDAKEAGRNRVRSCDVRRHERRRTGEVLDGHADGRRMERRRRAPAAVAPAAQVASIAPPRRAAPPEEHEPRSLLAEDRVHRSHLVDLSRRLRDTNRPAYALAFAPGVAAAPVYGILPLLIPALGGMLYALAERCLERVRRPEYLLGTGWILAQLSNAAGFASIGLTGGAAPIVAPTMLAIMVIGSSAVYPRRAVAFGVAWAMTLACTSAYLTNPALARAHPIAVAMPVGIVLMAGLIGAAAGRSAIDHRTAAVVDRLTGLLNRAALISHAAELAHHATATGQPVAVLVADLDRFKAVNDEHGHAAGDEVLKGVAARIRGCLRPFDFACRAGGEEFVVLLPGVTAVEAAAVAERIRDAVRSQPIAGLRVTISVGVSATPPGEPFDHRRVLARADAALYRAKDAGRDRVEVDSGEIARAVAA